MSAAAEYYTDARSDSADCATASGKFEVDLNAGGATVDGILDEAPGYTG